jgi:sulfite reductase (ferredoxin)
MAAGMAYESMLHGAVALLNWKGVSLPSQHEPGYADIVVDQFRKYFYDTQLFFDPFTGGKFAQYFFAAHEHTGDRHDAESAHRLIEEAQLFIEACHSCYGRAIAIHAAVV